MEGTVFGRTNEVFPSKWLRLIAPENATHPGSAEALVQAALEAKTVIDISTSPALWGGFMRGTGAPLMILGTADLSRTVSEEHAKDIVQAHLIEALSAIGRDQIDFYFLRVAGALKEFQISGALVAMEGARQDGNVRFNGLAASDLQASLGVLQFHDAFEAILVDDGAGAASIKLLAKSRRLAIVTKTSNLEMQPDCGQASLIQVSTPAEILAAMRQMAAAS